MPTKFLKNTLINMYCSIFRRFFLFPTAAGDAHGNDYTELNELVMKQRLAFGMLIVLALKRFRDLMMIWVNGKGICFKSTKWD